MCGAQSIMGALFLVIYNDSFQTRQNEASFAYKYDAVEAQEDFRAVTRGIVKLKEI